MRKIVEERSPRRRLDGRWRQIPGLRHLLQDLVFCPASSLVSAHLANEARGQSSFRWNYAVGKEALTQALPTSSYHLHVFLNERLARCTWFSSWISS